MMYLCRIGQLAVSAALGNMAKAQRVNNGVNDKVDQGRLVSALYTCSVKEGWQLYAAWYFKCLITKFTY